MAEIEVTGDVAALVGLEKQIRFATAAALTATAKEGQEEAQRAIEDAFINRDNWYLPQSPVGVRVTPATPASLESEVHSGAAFLEKHERGGRHTAEGGGQIAVPTRELRPNPRASIPASMRPRNLAGAFVLKTRRGPVLFQRGPEGIRALYGLERSVEIKRQSVIVEPTERTVEERFAEIFGEWLERALETAK